VAHRLGLIGDRQQLALDPVSQRDIRPGLHRVVHQQGQCFGQVADLVVTVIHQPRRRIGDLGHPRAQLGVAGDLLARAGDLAAGQQEQGPRRIVRGSLLEVTHQRGTLVAGGGAAVQLAVERGEAFHSSSP